MMYAAQHDMKTVRQMKTTVAGGREHGRSPPGVITVLIADDHAIVRQGVRCLLEAHDDIRVLGEASNGRNAVEMVRDLKPAVVIMDIVMPELNGIEATGQIVEIAPHTAVVILSDLTTSESIFRALKAGAKGYVFKRCTAQELERAVRAAYAGRRYLTPPVTEAMVEGYIGRGGAVEDVSPLDKLSGREREVLQLLVEGHQSADIAQRLSLADTTVHTYRRRIMDKLGIHSLPGLVRFAILHGLTPLE